jgi:regulator of sirC expression with transglutaminase-like and TPR domain
MSGPAPVPGKGGVANDEERRHGLDTLEPRGYLQLVGELDDDAIDLAQAALALAALDHPDRPLSVYLDHLNEISAAAAAATSASASVDMQANALLEVMTRSFGYRGDSETYEDIRNADLMEVIDRRSGLPVALGVLFMHAVRGYGGRVVGLAFPAHFCIRLEARAQRLIMDPFEAVVLSAQDLRRRLKERVHRDAEMVPAYHQPVGARDILLRLQNNIRFRALRSGDLDRALAIIARMALIAPGRGDLRREMALIYARQGNVVTAIRVLEDFLSTRASGGAGAADLGELLRRLRAATLRP